MISFNLLIRNRIIFILFFFLCWILFTDYYKQILKHLNKNIQFYNKWLGLKNSA